MGMILLNTLALCMDYYGSTETYELVLGVANNVFVGIFTLEAILKLSGLGPRYYFLEAWNIFDCSIVILSLIAVDPRLFGNVNVTPLRIIRAARLVKMVKTSKGLKNLLKTLFSSLGNIANVAMLMFLIFFTFTCAGMALFGEIDLHTYDGINYMANFSTFYQSFTFLFRNSTGEDWNNVMRDCVQAVGIIAYFYWFFFVLATTFIIVNVFVAVISEAFDDIAN